MSCVDPVAAAAGAPTVHQRRSVPPLGSWYSKKTPYDLRLTPHPCVPAPSSLLKQKLSSKTMKGFANLYIPKGNKSQQEFMAFIRCCSCRIAVTANRDRLQMQQLERGAHPPKDQDCSC